MKALIANLRVYLRCRQAARRDRPIPGADEVIAWTKAPRPPAPPGRGRLFSVVKTWECRCQEVWCRPDGVLHFPCDQHMDTEIKGLSR